MIRRNLALMAVLLSAGAAHAAFTGDAANWTTTRTAGSNASAVFSADAETLTLTSTDITDPADALWGMPSVQDTSLTLAQDTQLSFHWDYLTDDEAGSSNDLFGYSLNGVFTALSAADSWDAQSGNVSLSLAAGTVFSFTMQSADSIFGAATATVSAFSATPSAVPEPSSMALLFGGVLMCGGLSWMRKQQGK